MALTVLRLRRLEVWSNWACNGGQRQLIVTDKLACSAIENFQGSDKLTITVPLGGASDSSLVEGAYLRTDQDDAPTFDEWRVISRVEDSLAGTVAVEAIPAAANILGELALITQTLPNGMVTPDFDALGLDPLTHITQWILPALPSYVTAGTSSFTGKVDMTYAWDTPLAALQRLLTLCQQCELDVRRNGVSGYTINIVSQVNGTAATSDVRALRNLTQLKRTRSRLQQATRVYPRGAQQPDKSYATMAGALWKVTAIAGTTLTLADPAGGAGPIQFDNQLVGNYLRMANGAVSAVSASSYAAQTITVGSVGATAVGDLIWFVADAAGNDLIYLESPADKSASGVKVGMLDRKDIVGATNFVKNPVMRVWPGSLPTNWNLVGTVTTSAATTKPYYELGTQSLRCQTTADGAGVRTDAVALPATAAKPYASGFVHVRVSSGQVRVELVFTTPGGTVVHPLPPNMATSDTQGIFINLGVAGENYQQLGATAVAIQCVQHGSPAADFYVNGAQLTNTATQEAFVEGSGATQLWQAANEQLRTNASALNTLEVTMIDLARVDPSNWPLENPPMLGAPIRIVNSTMGLSTSTRVMEVDRNYLAPGATRIVLSSNPTDLTGTLGRPARPDRGIGLVVSTPVAAGNPTLSVVTTPADDQYTMTVTGTNLTYNVDGVAQGAIASGSVFHITRGSRDVLYEFFGTANGVTESRAVVVPAAFKVGPELSYTLDTAGNLTVYVNGRPGADRTYISVRTDRRPTPLEIYDPNNPTGNPNKIGPGQTTGAIPSGTAASPWVIPAHTNFWIGAISLTASGSASDPAYLDGSWLGIGITPPPTVTLSNPRATDRQITYDVALGPTTQRVEFFITDAGATDPGVINVEGVAAEVYDWIERDPSNSSYQQSITFPVFKPGDWLAVSGVPTDALHRRGSTYSRRDQATASAPSAPNAATLGTPTMTSNSMAVTCTTNAAGTAPAYVRPFLDGVQQPDIAVSGLNAAINISYINLVPGSTHNLQVYEVSSTGGVSPVSNTATGTCPTDTSAGGGGTSSNGKLPTPSITSGTFDTTSQSVLLYFSAGGTMPSGTTYSIMRATSSGGTYTDVQDGAVSSPAVWGGESQGATPQTLYYKLVAKCPGYTDSDPSAYRAVNIPAGKA